MDFNERLRKKLESCTFCYAKAGGQDLLISQSVPAKMIKHVKLR